MATRPNILSHPRPGQQPEEAVELEVVGVVWCLSPSYGASVDDECVGGPSAMKRCCDRDSPAVPRDYYYYYYLNVVVVGRGAARSLLRHHRSVPQTCVCAVAGGDSHCSVFGQKTKTKNGEWGNTLPENPHCPAKKQEKR